MTLKNLLDKVANIKPDALSFPAMYQQAEFIKLLATEIAGQNKVDQNKVVHFKKLIKTGEFNIEVEYIAARMIELQIELNKDKSGD